MSTLEHVAQATKARQRFMKLGFSLTAVVAVCGWLVAAGLLAVAGGITSRLVALAVLIPLTIVAWWAVSKRHGWRLPPRAVVIPAILVAVGLYTIACLRSPSGRGSGEGRLMSVYRGVTRFSRCAPAWVVDEGDQIRLGALLLPWIDPFMSRAQARNFGATFNAVYAELEQCPDFVQIGSSMAEAYMDLLPGFRSVGHAYVYHPAKLAGRHRPVLVFLHGWLGNMKAYVWTWKRLADEHGFVVICPSFRNGRWDGNDGEETLRWLDGLIRSDPMCDPARVIVVGLSNGGTGVTRWAITNPHTFEGLVYVSPVMEGCDTPEFMSAIDGRPVLVVHGKEDNRIPVSYVDKAVSRMKGGGVDVRSI